jgi:hypothetical protein
VDAVQPYVDVVSGTEVPIHEVLPFDLPPLGEAGDGSGRKTDLGAEEPFERRHEVPAAETVEVQERQDLRYLRRAAHVGREDHALESVAVTVLVHPAIVDSRGSDLHRSGPAEDLALSGVAVAHHQGVPMLILLSSGRLDVGFHLGFEGLGEHPPRSGSGDLVEIEGELFAELLAVV